MDTSLIPIWKNDPELFCRQVLGMKLWSKQAEILESVVNHRQTLVPSCNGAGKTEIAAAAALWWLFTRESKVITTAPTDRQVGAVLWGRIHSIVDDKQDFLGGEFLSRRIRIAPDWEAIGFATTDPSKFQGFHAPGGVLIVVEEAAGVTDSRIWDAMEGCLVDSKSRLLAIANPTTTNGAFYSMCKRPIPGQREVIPISAFDTPNVKAGKRVVDGLVESEFIEMKRLEWGEESPMWAARVLGEFPRSGSEALFPLGWLERAFEPGKEHEPGDLVVAMDVARKGDDKNAICVREGSRLLELTSWTEPDTTKSVQKFIDTLRKYRPDVARIDTVGLGGPMYDTVMKMRRDDKFLASVQLEEFQASHSPWDEGFRNKKAEAYWHFRSQLQNDKVDLSRVEFEMRSAIEVQATSVMYEYDPNSRLKIEDKQKMRSRKGFSPDELEAIIMCYWDTPGLPSDPQAILPYADETSEFESDLIASHVYDYSRYHLGG